MTATISFSGSGFSYDIDLYGFPAGSLVTIAFSSDTNPAIYSIDTSVGYGMVHTIHQDFPQDMQGNWTVQAVGGDQSASNTITIGNPTIQGIIPGTETPLENVTNSQGTVPVFGKIEDATGAAVPEAIKPITHDNTNLILIGGAALAGAVLLMSSGKKKVFA